MNDQANGEWDQLERRVTRRRFVGLTIGGGAAVLSGGPILQAATVANAEGNSVFKIGGDLSVNRLGFGAMRITGYRIWGWPTDRGGTQSSQTRGRTGRELDRYSRCLRAADE